MEITNVLVTGCNGYIGAVLVEKLIQEQYTVTGFDTFYNKNNSLGTPFSSPHFTPIQKDVRTITEGDLKSFDAIIHLSALSNDPIGEFSPTLTLDINHKATVSIAKMAKKVGVKRFIFPSSCSIYGIAENGVVDETSPVNALTAYAQSKALVERDLMAMADSNFYVGLMRNSTVYGFSPQLRSDLVVNNFVACALAHNRIEVMSDGSPWRPLIDVRDVSDIFIRFLSAPWKETNGNIINIGFNENNFQVKDLLHIIQKQLPDCTIKYTGEHGSDARSYRVVFDKLHRLLPGIKQQWTIEKSVKDLIAQLKKFNFTKDDFTSGKYARLEILKKLMKSNKINNELFWTNHSDLNYLKTYI